LYHNTIPPPIQKKDISSTCCQASHSTSSSSSKNKFTCQSPAPLPPPRVNPPHPSLSRFHPSFPYPCHLRFSIYMYKCTFVYPLYIHYIHTSNMHIKNIIHVHYIHILERERGGGGRERDLEILTSLRCYIQRETFTSLRCCGGSVSMSSECPSSCPSSA
jgi:hypothetical protein